MTAKIRTARLLLVLGMLGIVGGALASIDQIGNAQAGDVIEKGKWAYVVPPTVLQDDHQTVAVVAPPEQWIVGGGPYASKRACEHSRSLAAIEADSQLSAARANAYANPVAQAAAKTYADQGMNAKDALEKAVEEITSRASLVAVQRRHSVCEQSDGSAPFRVPQPAKPDPNAPYEH